MIGAEWRCQPYLYYKVNGVLRAGSQRYFASLNMTGERGLILVILSLNRVS